MTKIITRAEARERGLKWYRTGKPCLRGHVAERYTGSGNCVACKFANDRSEHHGRPPSPILPLACQCCGKQCKRIHAYQKFCAACGGGARRMYDRRYREANRQKILEYRAANRERESESNRKWFAANPSAVREYRYRQNIKVSAALLAMRELGLPMKRTPKNITIARNAVKLIEQRARALRELGKQLPTPEK